MIPSQELPLETHVSRALEGDLITAYNHLQHAYNLATVLELAHDIDGVASMVRSALLEMRTKGLMK